MSEANKIQVGGSHYQKNEGACPNCGKKLQHWDLAAMFGWDYFQGQVTKYVMRWRGKNGIQDLEKGSHVLQKYIEVIWAEELAAANARLNSDPLRGPAGPGEGASGRGYTDQDGRC